MKSAADKQPKESTLKTTRAEHRELKTDAPLSEKDEVKQAEAKMRKSRRGML